uniref:Pyrin domain-containing protein n=1 Tax=Cyprinus carpio TaxID=7962 RepID=A0A8C1LY43_CYPCA
MGEEKWLLLLNSLKDLREAELKEFQWHLKNDHESISESEMEKADRLKTVDKMVECFGPEEALKITVKILKKMNQNSLAVENASENVAFVEATEGATEA